MLLPRAYVGREASTVHLARGRTRLEPLRWGKAGWPRRPWGHLRLSGHFPPSGHAQHFFVRNHAPVGSSEEPSLVPTPVLSFPTEGVASHSCSAQGTIKAGEEAVNTPLALSEALPVRIPQMTR